MVLTVFVDRSLPVYNPQSHDNTNKQTVHREDPTP